MVVLRTARGKLQQVAYLTTDVFV